MQVTFACPSCDAHVRTYPEMDDTQMDCPACGVTVEFPTGATEGGKLHQCLVCPCQELFLRKDFPQRVGVTIVVIGFVLSCIFWYFYSVWWTFASLFAVAVIDLLLYLFVGEVLTCYRCGAMYRGLSGGVDNHGPFDLETHERFRQQAARLKSSVPERSTS